MSDSSIEILGKLAIRLESNEKGNIMSEAESCTNAIVLDLVRHLQDEQIKRLTVLAVRSHTNSEGG